MKFRVVSELLEQHELLVEGAHLFTGPKVYFDGELVELNRKNKATLDFLELEVKKSPFDSVPKIMLNGVPHYPAGKLLWHERIVIYLPLGFMTFGGAIGGWLGALSSYVNGTLIREYREKPYIKYSLCLTSICFSGFIYALAATLIQMVAETYNI